MDFSNTNSLLSLAGVITTVAGAFYAILKILRELRKSKEKDIEKIINECKELDQIVKGKLESKISVLEAQLQNLRSEVNKDLSNLKDNHAIELKNLGERIEALRVDLTTQHSQIIGLLAKLIP